MPQGASFTIEQIEAALKDNGDLGVHDGIQYRAIRDDTGRSPRFCIHVSIPGGEPSIVKISAMSQLKD